VWVLNIEIREVTKEHLNEYVKIPMWFKVTSKFNLNKVNGGLGGITFDEIVVAPYIKDLSLYDKPLEWSKRFDISNWGFFIAYDNDLPIGGATLAYNTEGVKLLSNRKDITVLWDLRVAPEYKSMGIGSKLFSFVVNWSKERNCKQIKIETQNNNVPACKFYAKQGAVLAEINEYAYYGEDDDEVMLIWYLDLV
jgi:ribosomal protein S18 acetylase RimI-like enzyme